MLYLSLKCKTNTQAACLQQVYKVNGEADMTRQILGFKQGSIIERNGIVCVGYNAKPVCYNTNFLFFLINVYVRHLV